ncbi:MAG: cell wall-active antibiotics response protein [Lachnospiraceae bacterium]|nr:cell wall-active antibiotics response protein [Lachnospiraceae bacterium]
MRKGRNYIWGIIFLVAAFLMLIGKFDFFEDFGMWRVVVGALIVMWLIDGLKRREWGSILFPTAFLCIIFDELPLFDKITPWPVLWAALFGTLGLGMLFGNKRNGHIGNYREIEDKQGTEDKNQVDNEFRFSTAFSSGTKYVVADDFKKANVSCYFGDLKIYFDDTVIKEGEAVINVDVKFGSVSLYVPKGWYVTNSAVPIFGAVEEKNKSLTNGEPKVRIEGNVAFGDVSVTYC